MTVKVLIADDQAVLRQGLRQLLSDEGPECELSEVDGFDSALDALARNGGDLLLIDLGMPGMAGPDSLRALRETHPDTRIAVLTGSDDRTTILECLGAGVHGYILKSSPMDEISRAITTVLAGGIYVAPSLAEQGPARRAEVLTKPRLPALAGAVETAAASDEVPRFTSRQLDVLRLLQEGRSTKEIARTLDLGPGTVKIHLAAIFRVLHAHNRTEAVVLASKLKL